ncbi:hypothetical protein T459_32975 [Capsicum annuum]|uniref:Uncharacterized protein n=1 Tax=Capsicum annuum TaxID=4072 RepID=A0A2G2Y085_CAPAN|nr:hypothetical protein T459_32975 [Capsicum annuum]
MKLCFVEGFCSVDVRSLKLKRLKLDRYSLLDDGRDHTLDIILQDYGVIVAVYAEYLSKGLGILSSGIDAQYHRLRYARFLCKYESEKAENDYFNENDDPPTPSSKIAPKQTDRVLHI